MVIVADLRKRLADMKTVQEELSRSVADASAEAKQHQLMAEDAEQNLSAAQKQLENLQADHEKLVAEKEELQAYKSAMEQQLTCSCGKKFDTLSQLFGHQRKCSVHRGK